MSATVEPSIQEKLLEALETYDAQTRKARAERIQWLSLDGPTLPVVMGRTETLHLIEEARQSFINGHFIAALLVSMACIEHCMVEELELLGLIQGSPQFGQAIKIATRNQVFPPDWLERAERLSLRRNSFVHLKEPDHRHALGARIREEQKHPQTIVEADAKDAVSLMYDFFVATLRKAAFD